MRVFVSFNLQTGQIKKVLLFDTGGAEVPPELLLNVDEGCEFLEVSDATITDDKYYVFEGACVLRPVLSFSSTTLVADGVASISVQMPAGSKVFIDDKVFTFDTADVFEFSTDEAREYQYRLKAPFPFVDNLRGVLTAVEPVDGG